jgi:hypothetical protein
VIHVRGFVSKSEAKITQNATTDEHQRDILSAA